VVTSVSTLCSPVYCSKTVLTEESSESELWEESHYEISLVPVPPPPQLVIRTQTHSSEVPSEQERRRANDSDESISGGLPSSTT
jgi:hypothetical protein